MYHPAKMALRNALNRNRYLDHAEPATWIEVADATIGMMLLRRLSTARSTIYHYCPPPALSSILFISYCRYILPFSEIRK